MAEVTKLTPLTPEKKAKIIQEIMDWELDTPFKKRTPTARARHSRHLGYKNGVPSLQVGAIRAQISAGTYGTMKTMRARRRKERAASSSN